MALPSSGIITMAQIQAEFGGTNPISLSEYYKGGPYVSASDAAPNVPTSGAISVGNFYGAAKNVVGQVAYTTPGTYSWVCPAGVFSVCVLCVSSGGISKGSGGSLAYGNNIPVVPGQSYTVRVGLNASGAANTRSYFISTAHLMSGGGLDTSYGVLAEANAGTYLSGGGRGGGGGQYGDSGGGGGGGAGGYSGNGGAGGYGEAEIATNGAAGSGGGGGGGGGVSYLYAQVAPGGGGVGLLGQGASGAGAAGGGYGGSGGVNGGVGAPGGGQGGNYGGGAGDGARSSGAVRIIWGSGRAFPSTNTGNL